MKKVCYVVTVPTTVRAFFIPQLRYLAEKGLDITVICSPDEMLQGELGKKIRYIPVKMPRGINVKESITAVRELYRIFKKYAFDLVQYSTPNAAFYAAIASRLVGVRVRNYHLMGYRYLGAEGIGRVCLKQMEILTCRFSTDIECVSRSNLELGIGEKIFPAGKASVVWNGSSGGVDLKRFAIEKRGQWREKIRKKTGCPEDAFVFGFVGRITKDKGIDELFCAFRKISLENPDAFLLLIGEFEQEDALNPESLEWARQSRQVKFISSVGNIEEYYAALDVLVLPSYREGFGNVVIEAGAVGTPAIITEIPGPIDAIKVGVTGITVKKADAGDLAAAMQKFVTGERSLSAAQCYLYVKEQFDSERLCREIYLRKKALLHGI